MGLPVSVHLRGPDVHATAVAHRIAAVFAELRAVDCLFSTYRPDSEISRLNRGELDLQACRPVVREVIARCERARERTGGYFDARRLPLPTGGLGYDPSGLVKGWAVERAVRHLAELDGYDRCLNAGGDVAVFAAPGRPAWRVGVEDPAEPARLLDVLSLTAGAVATSGTAHRGSHLIDPHRGQPATQVRAVTVTGPSLLWADVYATAAAARGPGALDWLDEMPGYEAMLVGADGAVCTTAGWAAGRPVAVSGAPGP
jgi:thiamine biosynthesis lipoprotein